MLLAKLRVQLREGLVLASPCVDLLLQSSDLIVLGLVLQLEIRIELTQLLFEVLHATIILLQHELVSLVLCPSI